MNDLSKDSIQHICSFLHFSEIHHFLYANNLQLEDLDHVEFIDKINNMKKAIYNTKIPTLFSKGCIFT